MNSNNVKQLKLIACKIARLRNNVESIIVFLVVFFMVAYAPFLSLITQGIKAPFNYFAADAFYYLSVADHSVNTSFYTFDQYFPTNGFHPIWQYYLTFIFKFINSNQQLEILVAFYSSIFFTALGSALFALSLLKLTKVMALAVLGAVPSIYYLFFSGALQYYAPSPWSFCNGMESPFSILFFGITVYLIINKDFLIIFKYDKAILVSVLLTLITLSRLDDIFIFFPFLVFLLIFSNGVIDGCKKVSILFMPGIIIGCYLLYNFYYSGMVLPVSALAKGGADIKNNLIYLLNIFIPYKQVFYYFDDEWRNATWRIMQIIIPLIISCFWIINNVSLLLRAQKNGISLVWRESYGSFVFYGLNVYVILKALYNITNVSLFNQGYWYFPLSIMIFNMVAVTLISDNYIKDDDRNVSSKNKNKNKNKIFFFLITFFFVLLIANVFIDSKHPSAYSRSNYSFWIKREEITENLYKVYSGKGIIELDDGIIAYSLPIPAMGGFGFTLDKEAFKAKQRGKLLELAYHRGFRAFASLSYLNYFSMPENINNDRNILQKTCESFLLGYGIITADQINHWQFRILYYDHNTGAVFIEFIMNP